MKINNGNDHLSAFDRKLWDFTYHVLLKYGCPIIFKKEGPNCPHKIDLCISFFVSKDHINCQEVIKFIENEWKKEESEGKEMSDGSYMFGVRIFIFTYDGCELYLKRKESEEIAKAMTKYFIEKVNDYKFLKENGIKP
jgi:hypothetical protein